MLPLKLCILQLEGKLNQRLFYHSPDPRLFYVIPFPRTPVDLSQLGPVFREK